MESATQKSCQHGRLKTFSSLSRRDIVTLGHLPDIRGKYMVEETDATTPMMEKANAMVSTSCPHERLSSKCHIHNISGTYRELALELAPIAQLREERVVRMPQRSERLAIRGPGSTLLGDSPRN